MSLCKWNIAAAASIGSRPEPHGSLNEEVRTEELFSVSEWNAAVGCCWHIGVEQRNSAEERFWLNVSWRAAFICVVGDACATFVIVNIWTEKPAEKSVDSSDERWTLGGFLKRSGYISFLIIHSHCWCWLLTYNLETQRPWSYPHIRFMFYRRLCGNAFAHLGKLLIFCEEQIFLHCNVHFLISLLFSLTSSTSDRRLLTPSLLCVNESSTVN